MHFHAYKVFVFLFDQIDQGSYVEYWFYHTSK